MLKRMTHRNTENLRLIILNCPHQAWLSKQEGKFVREIFGRMVTLKFEGYGLHYPETVIPCDQTDYFGSHLLVCEERASGFEPLLAYRCVTQSGCETYHHPFPFIDLVTQFGKPSHQAAAEKILEEARARNEDVRYYSAYTLAPSAMKDRTLAFNLRDILAGTHALWVQSEPASVNLICSVVNHGVNNQFRKWGYEPVTKDRFDYIPYGVGIELLKLKDFTPYVLQRALKVESLWKNRLIFGQKESLKKAA